jgi:transcriptional regulator with XRE-family HTH domain
MPPRSAKRSDDFTDITAKRIKERLQELDLPVTTAAEKAGLDRGYVSDWLTGKKKTITAGALIAIAAALKCSVAYLVGESDTPNIRTSRICDAGANRLRIEGYLEAGAYRRATHIDIPTDLCADTRWPAEQQAIYQVIGNSADEVAKNGDLVQVLKHRGNGVSLSRDALFVVVDRTGDLQETSLRHARIVGKGIELWAPSKSMRLPPIHIEDSPKRLEKIVGTAIGIYQPIS